MIEMITSKEFLYTFAGGAGSISITAFLWLIIYYGKKYLTRRNAFDIFSRNVLQIKQDFHSVYTVISERVRIANDAINACQSLQAEADDILIEFSRTLSEINNNLNDETKMKELMKSFKDKLQKNSPYFRNSINKFFHLTGTPSSKNGEVVAIDLDILKAELGKVVPNYINPLFQYFDFKIPTLKEIDNERLGFLNTKHRNIIEIYNDIIKRSHVVENNYNLILKDISGIKMERQFILNVAIVHINLSSSIVNLINKVESLIKENNLVRDDFRLTTLPENTFNKTKFYWRPIFWIFRWFA